MMNDVCHPNINSTDDSVSQNPLNTGSSSIIFAHCVNDSITIDKVIDVTPPIKDTITKPEMNASEENTIEEDDTSEPTQDVKPTKLLTEEERIAQIERDVVDYPDATTFGEKLRKISLAGLVKMAENAQVNTWERIGNIGIRKMRVVMELKKAYFPNLSDELKVGPSPWKKIPTSDLKAKAEAKNCVWKPCGNEGINRMRLIMSLKAIGVTAEEFIK